MARKLKGDVTVYVTGDDGRPKALSGCEPTSAEAEQITNPDVWEDRDDSPPSSDDKPKRRS